MGAIGVLLRLHIVSFDLVQQWREDFPTTNQLISAHEITLIASHDIQKKSRVRVFECFCHTIALCLGRVVCAKQGCVNFFGAPEARESKGFT